MLRHLELIDDEAAEYEVKIVKIDDPLMAKKHGFRDPPGLGFFRKGIFLLIFRKNDSEKVFYITKSLKKCCSISSTANTGNCFV